MATPAQNTSIILCRQLPVDDKNYPWLESEGAVNAFVRMYQKEELQNYTISPRYPNVIGVAKNIDWLADVNYIGFKNADYGGRWTYARVKRLDYQSFGSTLINFEIDQFLTWMGDFRVQECFVEREHCAVADDLPHLQNAPEGLETGPYIYEEIGEFNPSGQYIYLYAAETSQGFAGGYMQDNIYYGCVVARQPISNAGAITAEIDNFAQAGKLASIIGVYQGPEFADSFRTFTCPQSIGGYTPKNKKVLAYPYNFLQVSNNQGGEARLRYELGGGGQNIALRLASVGGANGCALAYPNNYAGISDNYDEGVIMKDYPVSPFTGDAFANWSAQNRIGNIAGVAGGILGMAAGIATATPMAIAGGAVTLANSVSAIADNATMPNQARGHMGGSYLNAKLNRFKFSVRNVHITADMAARIDDYFSRFGYRTNRLKVPNLNNRPVWNYVKTATCGLWGWFPPEADRVIQETFNNGVTLWKDGSFIGEFWRENR